MNWRAGLTGEHRSERTPPNRLVVACTRQRHPEMEGEIGDNGSWNDRADYTSCCATARNITGDVTHRIAFKTLQPGRSSNQFFPFRVAMES